MSLFTRRSRLQGRIRTRLVGLNGAFTVCFAIWTIFSIIGVRIKDELGLSEAEFGLLNGMPILTGSLVRIVLGILDQSYGGRLVYTPHHAGGRTRDLPARLCHDLSADAPRRTRRRTGGRLLRRGGRLCLAFLSAGKTGHGLSGYSVPATSEPRSRKFLAPFVLVAFGWQAGRAGLGGRAPSHGGCLLALDGRRSSVPCPPRCWCTQEELP